MSYSWSRAGRAATVRRLFVAGIFALLAAPMLLYASLQTGLHFVAPLYSVLADGFLLAGFGLTTWALFLARNQRALPPFALYICLCALIIVTGGVMLALSPDPTIFMATLIGALAGIVVNKLEFLYANPAPSPRQGPRIVRQRR